MRVNVLQSNLSNKDRNIIHTYFEERLPVTGWTVLSKLARDMRKQLKVSYTNEEMISALADAGWFMRITPRGPHNGADAVVSRTGVMFETAPRQRRAASGYVRSKDAYPQVPGALKEFLDRNVEPGTEVEVGVIYSKFCAEHRLGMIPGQVLTKQLDKTEYDVLSTTRWGRRVRMLQRRPKTGEMRE